MSQLEWPTRKTGYWCSIFFSRRLPLMNWIPPLWNYFPLLGNSNRRYSPCWKLTYRPGIHEELKPYLRHFLQDFILQVFKGYVVKPPHFDSLTSELVVMGLAAFFRPFKIVSISALLIGDSNLSYIPDIHWGSLNELSSFLPDISFPSSPGAQSLEYLDELVSQMLDPVDVVPYCWLDFIGKLFYLGDLSLQGGDCGLFLPILGQFHCGTNGSSKCPVFPIHVIILSQNSNGASVWMRILSRSSTNTRDEASKSRAKPKKVDARSNT